MLEEKYLSHRQSSEKFYSQTPHFQKLNKAFWDFFEKEDRQLWFSDLQDISVKTNIEFVFVRCFVSMLTSTNPKKYPKLLTQISYYQVQEGKEIVLLKGSPLKQLTEQLGIKEVSDEISTNLAFHVFPCWHPEPDTLNMAICNKFLKPENSLLALWSQWLG
jgi:hypothetical protein